MPSLINLTVTDATSDLSGKVQLRIVRFDGQLDETNVDEQAAKVYHLIETTPDGTIFVLDFEGLTYMNSKSIGFLTDWHLKVTSKKGEILVARARENILDILNVVGLTQIIRTYATLDQAKLAILQQVEGR